MFKCGTVPGKFRDNIGRYVFSDKDDTIASNDWPWMASLGFFDSDDHESGNWHHKCGASLITQHKLLTAAHCATIIDKE